MDKRTYDALIASIEKWERNATAKRLNDISIGAAECPLCVLDEQSYGDCAPCRQCPVMQATGRDECMATPFYECLSAVNVHDLGTFRHHAKREANFLRALVPAGGPDD